MKGMGQGDLAHDWHDYHLWVLLCMLPGSSYKAANAYQAGYDALEAYLPDALRRLEAQRKGLVGNPTSCSVCVRVWV
jgi:hypothetical protein